MRKLKASVRGITLHSTTQHPYLKIYKSNRGSNIEVVFFEDDLSDRENGDDLLEHHLFNIGLRCDGELIVNASIRISELEGFAYSIIKMVEIIKRDYGDIIKEQLLKGADI